MVLYDVECKVFPAIFYVDAFGEGGGEVEEEDGGDCGDDGEELHCEVN